MNNAIIISDVADLVDKVDLGELKNKNILIVGGTGLIGTYFIYSIIEASKRGIIPHKLSITHLHSLPDFLEFVKDYEWIDLLSGDLTDDNFVKSLETYDYILHLAGYGQPAQFSLNPVKTIKLNTTLTISLLDKLKTDGKFLFASSSGIYNGLDKPSFSEDDVGTTNTLHPRACYYEGKKCGEVIVNSYKSQGVNARSVRLSYVYGPGVRKSDERALYSFIKKGMNGKIEMLDDGSAQRIYCYVKDAVELMWKIFLCGDKEIYNVGGVEVTSIREIANIVGEILGADVIIPKVNNSVAGNHTVERLDMTRTLGQFPIEFVNLRRGIEKTIKWYKNNY